MHVAIKRRSASESFMPKGVKLSSFVPAELRDLDDPQTGIPRLAKDENAVRLIEHAVRSVPTTHRICVGDSREMSGVKPESVHLVLTSPPYWTLKEYRHSEAQLGHVEDYDQFLRELDRVWKNCFAALVPGGRLICVVGDVCLSRRENGGRHTVVPLHASIQEHCRKLGFDNLAPIIWHKISNAAYEVEGGGGFLGKPYEPNAVIKNDIEFILMERKPGGYRAPDLPAKILSLISAENHSKWFQQIWTGITGASTKQHPAPYPVELAERLIRMFSFVGDAVLDPFLGTGTTTVAAAEWGRNSIGFEVDHHYFALAQKRIAHETASLFSKVSIMAD
ncbi:MAG TPA: site-specific DNA-methyltransferase [Candidatus Acidoferrales bacterium]|nr:site-specific DNA-methyltransferase [Candidatus Acidoferrales bacterium]